MTKIHYVVITLSLILALSAAAWFIAAAAPMPQTGTAAPPFTLANQEDKGVSLQQFRGKWVVLYFYPKDFTSGCSLEAHNFQSAITKYSQRNAVIVGVSVDTADSHKSFCAKEGLNFILLSDAQHVVSKEYGSLMNIMGKTLSARNTFLIDPAGVIRKVYTKVNPSLHSDEVLADLGRLEKTAGK
jgi:peroxiredoxin Q/BCP